MSDGLDTEFDEGLSEEFDEGLDQEDADIHDIDVLDLSDEFKGQVDEMLDNLSLSELKELRNELTDTEDEIAEPLRDYSYHWDGTPTHNVEWDDESDVDPSVLERKLTRRR